MLRGDNPAMGQVNLQKTRTGLNRVWHALGYSLEGLRAGWGETAFRQEAIAAVVLLPLSQLQRHRHPRLPTLTPTIRRTTHPVEISGKFTASVTQPRAESFSR